MDQYGIAGEEKKIFDLQGYRYERPNDAVNYAKKLGETVDEVITEPGQ